MVVVAVFVSPIVAIIYVVGGGVDYDVGVPLATPNSQAKQELRSTSLFCKFERIISN